ncbi:MAG: T9SS type A sorting domain-containing protein [Bacteroidia bacterium]|nr:T9SS type A sorting domain-containing protein [Bacteroidia bacterium]
MKKTYLFMIAIFIFAITSVGNAAVIPYLPPLQNFGGTSVDLATFFPTTSDYTLEVQATAGTQISVADGVYTYTPEATGVVRFSQKAGKVYVYEGNVYKTMLTPVSNTQFPVIADLTAHSDVNNLLVNSSFETVGASVATNKYKFGSPWTSNVTEAEFGIRIGTSANVVNGTKVCVWRGSGNTNYFSQPLTAAVKSNKKYKVIVRQVDGGNATANFILGIGSTVNGVEYGSTTLLLGNGKNGTWSGEFTTPLSVTGQSYFTFKNTPSNTASSGSDPVVQMDYIALLEGNDVPGIVGVGSATFFAGSAYAPENVTVDFEAGDYYDMTPYVVNPSFEAVQADKQQTIPGWTKTGAANSEYCTRNDAGPASFKTGNVYFQYWSSSKPDFSISQVVTGLPNGKYRLTAGAGGDAGTTGTYIYAGDNQTHVTATGDHSVDAVVVDGTLTIGFKSVSRTVNWAFADNFRLYYLGEVLEPVISLSATSFFFDSDNLEKTFTVSGANLTSNAILTAPTGITLDKSSLTPAEVSAAVTVTATFDNSATILNQKITVTSGTLSKEIDVTGSADAVCFVPMGTPNLIPNPYLNTLSPYAGWGHKSIVYGAEAYCGAAAVKFEATTNTWPDGAALDVNSIAWEANSTYRVRAMVKSVDGTFAFFAKGTNPDVTISIPQSNNEWVLIDQTFTTGAAPATNFFSFNNVDGASTGKTAYIDNWELFKVSPSTSVSTLKSDSKLNAFVQNGRVVANFEANADGVAELVLYNIQGVQLTKVNASIVKGQNQYTFNAELPSGVYVIKMSENNNTTAVKVVK